MLATVWEPSYPCTLSKPLKEDSSFCMAHHGVMHRQHVLPAGNMHCQQAQKHASRITEQVHAQSSVEVFMLPGSLKQPRPALFEAILQMQLHTVCIPQLQRCLQLIGQAVPEHRANYLTRACIAKHTQYKFHKHDASEALQMKGWAQ